MLASLRGIELTSIEADGCENAQEQAQTQAQEQEPLQVATTAGLGAGGVVTACRSPSPAMLDQTPGNFPPPPQHLTKSRLMASNLTLAELKLERAVVGGGSC